MKRTLNFPTCLTLLRVFAVVPFVVLSLNEHYLAALVIFILASLTDFLDGFLARKLGMITDVGAFLDPLADKMIVVSALLCLVATGLVPVWVVMIIVCRDFAVDGMRMVGARKGKTISASPIGKAKTAVQMTAIVTFYVALITYQIIALFGWICLICAIFLTILSGAEYIVKGWKEFF